MYNSLELRAGDSTYFEGKRVKIVSTHRDYVIIEDINGNQSTVRKDVLMGTPLFNFYAEETQKERKEEIAHYQEIGREAGERKMNFLDKIKNLMAKMGLYDKSDDEYKALKDEYWAARFDKVSAGNQEYSAYLHAAMIASDPIVMA